MKIFVIAIIIVVAVYYFYKRGGKVEQLKTIDLGKVKTETIEGTIAIEDVVNFFKAQNLSQSTDIPFLSKKLNGLHVLPMGILEKPDYYTLVAGVNYEKDVKILEIIYAKAVDKTITDAFAGKDLIVLS
jgi:purine-cytosine permease-like protein